MGFVLMIHSLLRWLIVIIAIIALIKFGIGWLQKKEYTSADRGLGSAFSGMIDLQVLLGLIYLIVDGLSTGFPMYRIEHAITMIIAAGVAHLPMRWKTAESPVRFRMTFISILITLLLIFLGVAMLPGGWSR